MSYPPYAPPVDAEPPKHLPLYDASLGQAVKRFFTKYATFSGRASRSEYWWVQLASFLFSLTLMMVFMVIGLTIGLGAGMSYSLAEDPARAGSPPAEVFGGAAVGVVVILYIVLILVCLAILIPSIAVCVRRLHDAGYSGWWYLLNLVPGGSIVILVFTLLPSVAEGARFDDPPYGYPHPPNAPYLFTGYPPYQHPHPGQPQGPPYNPPPGPAPYGPPPAGQQPPQPPYNPPPSH